MYHAYFFINRILDPINSDVMNNVTYPRDNTRQIQENKLPQNKIKKPVKNDSPKFSHEL